MSTHAAIRKPRVVIAEMRRPSSTAEPRARNSTDEHISLWYNGLSEQSCPFFRSSELSQIL